VKLGGVELFIHYSRATYRDHGEIMYSPFPVHCVPQPLTCLHLFLLRDLPLEVGKGPREWHCPHFSPIWVVPPLRPAGLLLLGRSLCPLVSLPIACDSLVSQAPSDFNDDAWPSSAQRGNMLPCLEGVLLSKARFIRCHPSDGRLRIR